MATWKAKCWLGSSSGYQDLEVQSSTFHGAVEQFKRIYGAEQVVNCREVGKGGLFSSGSSSSSEGSLSALMWIVAIFIIIAYWYVVIPFALLILLVKFLFSRIF